MYRQRRARTRAPQPQTHAPTHAVACGVSETGALPLSPIGSEDLGTWVSRRRGREMVPSGETRLYNSTVRCACRRLKVNEGFRGHPGLLALEPPLARSGPAGPLPQGGDEAPRGRDAEPSLGSRLPALAAAARLALSHPTRDTLSVSRPSCHFLGVTSGYTASPHPVLTRPPQSFLVLVCSSINESYWPASQQASKPASQQADSGNVPRSRLEAL